MSPRRRRPCATPSWHTSTPMKRRWGQRPGLTTVLNCGSCAVSMTANSSSPAGLTPASPRSRAAFSRVTPGPPRAPSPGSCLSSESDDAVFHAEADWMRVLTVITTAAVVTDARPGTAFALFLAGYALLRFGLERLRGRRRPALRPWALRGSADLAGPRRRLAVGGVTGVLPGGAWAITPAAILGGGAGHHPRLVPTPRAPRPGARPQLARRVGRLELSEPDRIVTA